TWLRVSQRMASWFSWRLPGRRSCAGRSSSRLSSRRPYGPLFWTRRASPPFFWLHDEPLPSSVSPSPTVHSFSHFARLDFAWPRCALLRAEYYRLRRGVRAGPRQTFQELSMKARILFVAVTLAATRTAVAGQSSDPGRKSFESRCARCHGADGNGGEMGPSIVERLTARDDQQLRQLIRTGVPARGMPPSEVGDGEIGDLVKFLRGIERRPEAKPVVRTTATLMDGKTLEGVLMGQGFSDVQVLSDDRRVHLLRRNGDRFREVTSSTDWPSYNGDPRGNRYTAMTQIDKITVSRLAPKWVFTIP